jgi:hypothetical protein
MGIGKSDAVIKNLRSNIGTFNEVNVQSTTAKEGVYLVKTEFDALTNTKNELESSESITTILEIRSGYVKQFQLTADATSVTGYNRIKFLEKTDDGTVPKHTFEGFNTPFTRPASADPYTETLVVKCKYLNHSLDSSTSLPIKEVSTEIETGHGYPYTLVASGYKGPVNLTKFTDKSVTHTFTDHNVKYQFSNEENILMVWENTTTAALPKIYRYCTVDDMKEQTKA